MKGSKILSCETVVIFGFGIHDDDGDDDYDDDDDDDDDDDNSVWQVRPWGYLGSGATF